MTRNHVPAIFCGLVSAQDIDAKSFRCITEMTHVRQFYVDNLLGNLDATLAVAIPRRAVLTNGLRHTVIPGEAMVKRDKGFNPVTKDWEF